MKIRLLGTGGADGIPGLFSDSRVSNYARECGGKDVRTRSSALVDDGLKIDFPPDTFYQVVRDGLRAQDWTAVVYTHSDDDHLAVNQLQYALHPFTSSEKLEFTLYGNATVIDRLSARYPDWPMEAVVTHSFVPFEHGDYRVTPFRANHKHDEDSQNLVIERDGRALIYATDTGVWEPESWEFLASVRAAALVIECTDGFAPTAYAGHLDVQKCIEVVDRLRASGVLGDDAPVITTHHSHQGNGTYAELSRVLAPRGIAVGFDGCVVEV
ncbi:MAG: MBL fold metallo-hydrolase [Fimbriimonadaceae bacterium]